LVLRRRGAAGHPKLDFDFAAYRRLGIAKWPRPILAAEGWVRGRGQITSWPANARVADSANRKFKEDNLYQQTEKIQTQSVSVKCVRGPRGVTSEAPAI
jgi:hypothetical protein